MTCGSVAAAAAAGGGERAAGGSPGVAAPGAGLLAVDGQEAPPPPLPSPPPLPGPGHGSHGPWGSSHSPGKKRGLGDTPSPNSEANFFTWALGFEYGVLFRHLSVPSPPFPAPGEIQTPQRVSAFWKFGLCASLASRPPGGEGGCVAPSVTLGKELSPALFPSGWGTRPEIEIETRACHPPSH